MGAMEYNAVVKHNGQRVFDNEDIDTEFGYFHGILGDKDDYIVGCYKTGIPVIFNRKTGENISLKSEKIKVIFDEKGTLLGKDKDLYDYNLKFMIDDTTFWFYSFYSIVNKNLYCAHMFSERFGNWYCKYGYGEKCLEGGQT